MSNLFKRKKRVLGPWQEEMLDRMRSLAEELHEMIGMENNRCTSIAKTKLEEAILWAIEGYTSEENCESKYADELSPVNKLRELSWASYQICEGLCKTNL